MAITTYADADLDTKYIDPKTPRLNEEAFT